MLAVETYFWLCLASLCAGGINAIAGGGTLLTFPSLLAVIDPVSANATSTVALVPGSLGGAWGFRKELKESRRWLAVLIGPSLLGGIAGTSLVLLMEEKIFRAMVPWLILTAAVLFLLQPLTRRLIHRGDEEAPLTPRRMAAIVPFQFLVALYGGYFGAGIGILMLSGLGLIGLTHIHQMNALKNILGVCINGISCVIWIVSGRVYWEYALPMAVSAVLGGYLGARLSRNVRPVIVRWVVIAIGFGLAAYFFLR